MLKCNSNLSMRTYVPPANPNAASGSISPCQYVLKYLVSYPFNIHTHIIMHPAHLSTPHLSCINPSPPLLNTNRLVLTLLTTSTPSSPQGQKPSTA